MNLGILESSIGKLSHIDAGHTIGMNVKNLDSINDSNSTPEALKLKQDIKTMLAKTNPIPKAFNIVPDRSIDNAQFAMANEINSSMSAIDFRNNYVDKCSAAYDSILKNYVENSVQYRILQLYKEKFASVKETALVEDRQTKRRKIK